VAHRVSCGVSALVFDEQGRLLILHHTYRRPGWGLPSGLVGRREQPAEALARELREELGVSARIGALLHADHAAWRRHLTLYYRAEIAGEVRHSHETDAHRYVASDELAPLFGGELPAWLRVATGDSLLPLI
jgi:8-oxo-dGTP pyrophosphatase MutT (NUDIX family)